MSKIIMTSPKHNLGDELWLVAETNAGRKCITVCTVEHMIFVGGEWRYQLSGAADPIAESKLLEMEAAFEEEVDELDDEIDE